MLNVLQEMLHMILLKMIPLMDSNIAYDCLKNVDINLISIYIYICLFII